VRNQPLKGGMALAAYSTFLERDRHLDPKGRKADLAGQLPF
jgi:hypothetical protein